MEIVLKNKTDKEILLSIYAIVKVSGVYLRKEREYRGDLSKVGLYVSEEDVKGIVIEIEKVYEDEG